MSETVPPPPQDPEPDSEVLAMEQVLGLLSPEDEFALQRRFAGDADFAAAVVKWERNCAPLLLEVAPAAAPPHCWQAITAELGLARPSASITQLTPRARASWWNSVTVWRGAALAAAAAALVAVLVRAPPPPVPALTDAPAPLVAALAPAEGVRDSGVATYYPQEQRLVIAAAITPPEGKTAELWLIPPGGKALSIGFIDSEAVTLTLADAHAALALPGALLAVTIEPPGGAPNGIATGPVVSAGPLRVL